VVVTVRWRSRLPRFYFLTVGARHWTTTRLLVEKYASFVKQASVSDDAVGRLLNAL
jgi:hypothetical protein